MGIFLNTGSSTVISSTSSTKISFTSSAPSDFSFLFLRRRRLLRTRWLYLLALCCFLNSKLVGLRDGCELGFDDGCELGGLVMLRFLLNIPLATELIELSELLLVTVVSTVEEIDGAAVGATGEFVGAAVGPFVGARVLTSVGAGVGVWFGYMLGSGIRSGVGAKVLSSFFFFLSPLSLLSDLAFFSDFPSFFFPTFPDFFGVGDSVGFVVGVLVGVLVGALVGLLVGPVVVLVSGKIIAPGCSPFPLFVSLALLLLYDFGDFADFKDLFCPPRN